MHTSTSPVAASHISYGSHSSLSTTPPLVMRRCTKTLELCNESLAYKRNVCRLWRLWTYICVILSYMKYSRFLRYIQQGNAWIGLGGWERLHVYSITCMVARPSCITCCAFKVALCGNWRGYLKLGYCTAMWSTDTSYSCTVSMADYAVEMCRHTVHSNTVHK